MKIGVSETAPAFRDANATSTTGEGATGELSLAPPLRRSACTFPATCAWAFCRPDSVRSGGCRRQGRTVRPPTRPLPGRLRRSSAAHSPRRRVKTFRPHAPAPASFRLNLNIFIRALQAAPITECSPDNPRPATQAAEFPRCVNSIIQVDCWPHRGVSERDFGRIPSAEAATRRTLTARRLNSQPSETGIALAPPRVLSSSGWSLNQSIVAPPSMTRWAPVMNDASSDARNNTPFATSSGSPIRFISVSWPKRRRPSSLLMPR